MKNKFFCKPRQPRRVISLQAASVCAVIVCALARTPSAFAGGDAPRWMHAVAGVSLPSYDERVDAVLLYSETNVTVVAADKIKTRVREAYKILRPNGRAHGIVWVYFNPQRKIKSLHGWCIPAQGKDYEVKDKDAVDRSREVGGELVDDSKYRVLQIPAPDPGNVVGYEYEVEEQPFYLQDIWQVQETEPVRESHYSLQLPAGWEFKASWINHAEVNPVEGGSHLWQWEVNDVPEVRPEQSMPPMRGVMAQMVVSFFPAGGRPLNGFGAWADIGKWYDNLANGRTEASPEIRQQVAALTASKTSQLEKMQVLANFVQHDVRYVAIELGIGGWQPHPARDVFSHHYGDCKDKATLMRSMLREIGIDSYYVVINTRRGAIKGDSPPHNVFNHVITAVKLPDSMADASLVSIAQHPTMGKLLFFDPTNDMTPFGQIGGHLQDNYGLLVTPQGGELVELPQQPPNMNGIVRTGELALDAAGTLKGQITERRLGDRAWDERWRLRSVTSSSDRIKPLEGLLGGSLSTFHITKATIINLNQTDQPFGFDYSFESPGYAKNAGSLLLVRPRVIGEKSSGLLETKEPRKFPIEFPGPVRDTDNFAISLPLGYAVDDVPAPVDADYGFASYHSKTEVKDNVIHYSRTFEIKELSLPVSRADDLKKFYRIIASDERNTVVLKSSAH